MPGEFSHIPPDPADRAPGSQAPLRAEPLHGPVKRAMLLVYKFFAGSQAPVSPPVLSASLDAAAPAGFHLAHVAQTGMEAEIVRQVLRDNGFMVPHVPSAWTGLTGQIDNPNVYVRADEIEAAQEFLRAYLGPS